MNDGILRQLQLTQLEMLTYLDKVCEKFHLRYSLYAGTLLGAVRHKGFIPWDDDLDVCMPREDYEKLINLWPTLCCKEYILQNKENTPGFTQSFTKIRKKNSVFLQEYDVGKKYHTGIFIDIFPADRVPKSPVKKQLFYVKVSLYQLMVHEFTPSKSGIIVKAISGVILCVTTKKTRATLREIILKSIKKYDRRQDLPVVFIETLEISRKEYRSSLLDCYISKEFEGKLFPCLANWDEYLKGKYGDYLTLPPENEREWKHKPLQIDFENAPRGN